jgi:hypothetical protein
MDRIWTEREDWKIFAVFLFYFSRGQIQKKKSNKKPKINKINNVLEVSVKIKNSLHFLSWCKMNCISNTPSDKISTIHYREQITYRLQS